jgi:hypothetical protein
MRKRASKIRNSLSAMRKERTDDTQLRIHDAKRASRIDDNLG